jgi:hypothetical protein
VVAPLRRHLLSLKPGIQFGDLSSRKIAPSGLNLYTRKAGQTVCRVPCAVW